MLLGHFCALDKAEVFSKLCDQSKAASRKAWDAYMDAIFMP